MMPEYTDYECRLKLEELHDGRSVVIPSSMEHARFMLMIAQHYINQHHNDLIDIIKNSDAKI